MNRHGVTPVQLSCATIALVFSLCGGAFAQAPAPDLRFWGADVRRAGPEQRSVLVLADETPIFTAPDGDSAKRGTARAGARLPLFGGALGPGCRGRWWLVGANAFVCEDAAEPSALPASTAPPASANGLPYRYFFVRADGSFGYDALETAEEGVPATQLQPGFAVAAQRIADKSPGEAFALTSHGFWVPLRDLVEAQPVAFHGTTFSPGLAWVVRERATVFAAPQRPLRPASTLPRLTTLDIEERRRAGGEEYVRVASNTWLRAADVRAPLLSAPPPEALPGERWLDVDLSRQTLVAYRGETPVFATLVSSGRGAPGSETATPSGTFRVWVKLRRSDMDNVDDAAARENYAIEAVPWVMFFRRGYGLHGTFWHQRFGEVRSHGCINLAPKDAEYLFHFAGPRLAPGWSAVLPTPREPGTLIRIRTR